MSECDLGGGVGEEEEGEEKKEEGRRKRRRKKVILKLIGHTFRRPSLVISKGCLIFLLCSVFCFLNSIFFYKFKLHF